MVGPGYDKVRTRLGPGKDHDLDQELDNKDSLELEELTKTKTLLPQVKACPLYCSAYILGLKKLDFCDFAIEGFS